MSTMQRKNGLHGNKKGQVVYGKCKRLKVTIERSLSLYIFKYLCHQKLFRNKINRFAYWCCLAPIITKTKVKQNLIILEINR